MAAEHTPLTVEDRRDAPPFLVPLHRRQERVGELLLIIMWFLRRHGRSLPKLTGRNSGNGMTAINPTTAAAVRATVRRGAQLSAGRP
jgi:hypothetical protein